MLMESTGPACSHLPEAASLVERWTEGGMAFVRRDYGDGLMLSVSNLRGLAQPRSTGPALKR